GRARRYAGSECRPDLRAEAPELFEGLLPPHAGQVWEDQECLEPEHLLHLTQGVACLFGRAHDPGLACHALFEREGRAARQRWGAADEVGPEQLGELVVARPCSADRNLPRVGYVEIHLEHAAFTRSALEAVGFPDHGSVPMPPG